MIVSKLEIKIGDEFVKHPIETEPSPGDVVRLTSLDSKHVITQIWPTKLETAEDINQ